MQFFRMLFGGKNRYYPKQQSRTWPIHLDNRVKKFLVIGIAAVALSSAQTLAASPTAPIFNWTGCYVGGNVGYSHGRSKVDVMNDPFGQFPAQTSYPQRPHRRPAKWL
jgi:hypothetical protein